MSQTAAERWTCPTCGVVCESPYCSNCGEHVLHAHDLTLSGLAEQAAEAFVHFDGRVFHTFGALVKRPGELTDAYVRGRRKPFLGPLQLFLIANLLFFGFQSILHVSVFSNSLSSQLHRQFYKDTAARLVDARVERLHTTPERFAEAFDHAVAVNAKSLVVLMAPPMVLLAALLFFDRRRPFVTHVVFAIHFYAFFMMAFIACTVALVLAVGISVTTLHAQPTPGELDAMVSALVLSIAAVYLFVAEGVVYRARGAARIAKAGALAATAALTVIGYKYVVFLITLYTTGVH